MFLSLYVCENVYLYSQFQIYYDQYHSFRMEVVQLQDFISLKKNYLTLIIFNNSLKSINDCHIW